MSFDLFGLAEQNALENGGEIDPNDPLAPMRGKGGVNLAGAAPGRMQPHRPQNAPRRPQANPGRQAAEGAPQGHPGVPMQSPDILSPAGQANHLQSMINKVTRAYQDENDSRLAQLREARRMEHELAMEERQNDADLQKESMRKDALLARLGKQGAFRVYDPSINGFRYVDEVRFGG